MIYEYALDPKVILKWLENDDYLSWIRSNHGMGIGTPRFISTFPYQKKHKFLASIQRLKNDITDQKVIKRLDILYDFLSKNELIERECAALTQGEWSEKVIQEHNIEPFKAILSSEPVNTKGCISFEKFHVSGLWTVPFQLSLQRTLSKFTAQIEPFIIASSRTLIFADPYCYNEKAIKVIQTLLNSFSNKKNDKLPTVKIYYKLNEAHKNSASPNHVKSKLEEGLNDKSKKIKIIIMEVKANEESDVFHNRYILNEFGGLHFGYGFDLSGKVDHTDEVTLLSKDVYDKRWTQFNHADMLEIVDKVEFGG